MAFENLFKPRHLKRTVLAVAAGAAAILIYLTVEQFEIIPATGALDEAASEPPNLGARSILIVPMAAAEDSLAPQVVLELIRILGRVPDVEVIAPRSALALAAPRAPGRSRPDVETAWRLRLRSSEAGGTERLAATLHFGGSPEVRWTVGSPQGGGQASAFVSEVVNKLAAELDFVSPLSGGELEAVEPSVYRRFLRARFLKLGGIQEVAVADQLLEEIVEAAPGWAPGLAARAHVLLLRATVAESGAESLLALARDLIARARAAGPGLPEAYLYESQAAHRFDWDWQTAYEAARQALERAPGDVAALGAGATSAFTLGKFEEAAAHLRKAIALDPLGASHRVRFALALEFGGHSLEAIDAFRALMVFDPQFPGAHGRLARTLVVAGRPESGMLHAEIEPSPFWRDYAMALSLLGLGREDEADLPLQRLVEAHGHEAAVQIAEIHAFAGRADLALEWLSSAIEQRDPGVAELVGNPLFEGVRGDPGWIELLERVGLPSQPGDSPP